MRPRLAVKPTRKRRAGSWEIGGEIRDGDELAALCGPVQAGPYLLFLG